VAAEDRVNEEPAVVTAPVDGAIARELPGVGLAWCAFALSGDPLGRSPAALRGRLRALSDRHRGAQAIALRSRPIPHAYRALARQLGLDPDVQRITVEAAMVERLRAGAYVSRGWLMDALLVATVETEVGVWALDADRVLGALRLEAREGRVAVWDEAGRVADVLAAPAGERAVTRSTRRTALYALAAPGVPGIAVEEALWTAWDLLAHSS
jgi:DNA/RNA-binding domain of Phe-tRNA-synthetase-like protein